MKAAPAMAFAAGKPPGVRLEQAGPKAGEGTHIMPLKLAKRCLRFHAPGRMHLLGGDVLKNAK